MSEWTTASIEDCLDTSLLTRTRSIVTTEYLPSGRFPIIDQSATFIAGWTNDESAVITEGLPLVVFGDHTRALKFIDFPFARGADGTQLLRTVPGIDTYFFYFACRFVDVPSRGYNRHFTLLREQELVVPEDLNEQRRIAAVLGVVQQATGDQTAALEQTETLKRSVMQELFSRGLRGGDPQDSEIGVIPQGWSLVPIGELGQVVTGTTPPTKDALFYEGGRFPFIAPGDIRDGVPVANAQKLISDAGLAVSRPLPRGTTLVVCIGSSIGKVGQTTAEVSTTNQQINAIMAGPSLHPDYLFHLMTYHSDAIRRAASPSPVPILSKGAFERIEVAVSPDLDEQHEIAQLLGAIDAKIDLHRQKKALYEKLFQSLLRDLMTREIDVNDLDLSALPATEAVSA